MYRQSEQYLMNWMAQSRRKPLILRGARQVGKTFLIREFAKRHFPEGFVQIDFERNPSVHQIFEKDLNVQRLIVELELFSGKKIRPRESLLFFDEIQSCPKALLSLRYFYEDYPELHVIAAGSLLEFALAEISFPVGRVQFLNITPMTFGEYLKARGRDDLAVIVNSPPKLLPEVAHNLLLDELRQYMFIGGMPESVAAFISTNSISESVEVQRELTQAYRDDFAKYAPHADRRCLDQVMLATARSVGQRIKYTRLSEDFSQPTIKKAFELLVKAKVIHRIPAANPSGIPLGATSSAKIFKALVFDIGIMQSLCGLPLDIEYQRTDLIDIYRGAIAEQFVGQELIAALGEEIFFWSREAKSSTAEVDYLVTRRGQILPIEVKSGSARRLKSLAIFLESYLNTLNGVVLSSMQYQEIQEKRMRIVPLYFVEGLVKEESEVSG